MALLLGLLGITQEGLQPQEGVSMFQSVHLLSPACDTFPFTKMPGISSQTQRTFLLSGAVSSHSHLIKSKELMKSGRVRPSI